jgi:hypothetical protein
MRACGALVYAAVGNMRSASGWPDRYVQSLDWCGWLEFKAKNGALTKLQQHVGSCLEKRYVRSDGAQVRNYFVVRFDDTEVQLESSDGTVLGRCPAHGRELLRWLAQKL